MRAVQYLLPLTLPCCTFPHHTLAQVRRALSHLKKPTLLHLSRSRARRFGETEPNLLLARQSSPPNGQTEMMQPPLCILDAPHPFGYSFSARRCHNPSRSLYQTCIIHSFSLSHLHHHLFFFSHFNFSSPLSLSLIFQIFCSSIRPTACMFPLFPFPSSFSLDFESSHTCFRLLHFAKHASLLPR